MAALIFRRDKFTVPLLICLILSGCNSDSTDGVANPNTSGSGSATVDNSSDVDGVDSSEDTITVGLVRTIEVDGVVLSSLAESVNAPSSEKVELGRLLFWDPVLSGGRDVACATCHLPELSYTDGIARSIGHVDLAKLRGPDGIAGLCNRS